ILLIIFLYLFKTEALHIVALLLNGFLLSGVGILINAVRYQSIKTASLKTMENLKIKNELELKNKIIAEHLEKVKKDEKIKEEMFSQIAHELNTPLTIFLGNFNKVSQDKIIMKKYKKNIESVSRNLVRIKANIEKIFSLLRVDFQNDTENKEELININEIFKELKDDYIEFLTKEHIKLMIDNAECSEKVIMRKLDLRIILENLLENSIKFSKPGTIIKIGCITKQNLAGMYIEDQGIGIDTELEKHIYEKFVQGEDITKIRGMGLGLYIVKRIIDKYNGEIEIQSELNKGTRVTFYIKSQ
ncbi:HAMP domain-containing histidine kinase, partial [bacterium]|nr:HAMP domain-containing histidine kinase [bacterium]